MLEGPTAHANDGKQHSTVSTKWDFFLLSGQTALLAGRWQNNTLLRAVRCFPRGY